MDKVEHKNEALENTSQLFHIPVNNSLANWVYVMEINNNKYLCDEMRIMCNMIL